MEGLVTKSTGSFYQVSNAENKVFTCRLQGKLRLTTESLTNPVAVGDKVDFLIDGDYGSIIKVHPRKNYIIRKSNNLSRKEQMIAANIDLVLLMITIARPRTSYGFIDRYLAVAENFGIDVILLFNKLDLYGDKERILLNEYELLYNSLGYKFFSGSLQSYPAVEQLKSVLRKKVVLLAGHSGVGKSTLLNTIAEKKVQKTADISKVHLKGMHTTTFAEMFEIENEISLIDTPGIKDFGIVGFTSEEIQNGFREFKKYRPNCQFNNCSHTHEPNCAILEALNLGNISESRYYSYLSILEESINP